MTNNNSMTVITSKPFGSLTVDVYEDSKHEYYMTREQIGQALEYGNPQKAIDNIVSRNKERFIDKSVTLKLRATDGKMYDTIVLNMKGVMEICRFSRQPKADKFIDFCWDVMESLMRGDSVLATPKMDMAVTPEFIQAQFMELLKGQGDTTRKLKALHDELNSAREEIENLRGLTNETLATVSSVSTAVQKIKEKQMDDSIKAKSYTPRPEQISDWRRDMYDRIKVVAKINDMKVEEVMSKIYLYMRDVYGFVIEDERKKFKQKTGRSGHISTIDVVESSDMYKSIFESLVKDLHAEAISSKKENFFDPPKAIEAAPEADVNVAPVIEVEAKEVEPEQARPTNECEIEPLISIVEPIAKKMKDTSCNYQVTYRRIYRIIGFNRMSRMERNYSNENGKMAVPKTKMFIGNEKNMKVFRNAARILSERIEKKGN